MHKFSKTHATIVFALNHYSYYPLYPAYSNAALAAGSELPLVDSELWELYAQFPQGAPAEGTLRRPHILIVPSDLRFFVKVETINYNFSIIKNEI